MRSIHCFTLRNKIESYFIDCSAVEISFLFLSLSIFITDRNRHELPKSIFLVEIDYPFIFHRWYSYFWKYSNTLPCQSLYISISSILPPPTHAFFSPSYFDGKKKAEDAVLNTFKGKGFVLRPGFIYGTRMVPLPGFLGPILGANLSLPLGFVGRYEG